MSSPRSFAADSNESPNPNTVWRSWSGPTTEELRLGPGGLGMGKLPARLKPERTVRAICGFCSTGCSLDVHLRDDLAVNLTPTADYPVNLGMACPKGWESLTPLGASDRASHPLLRGPDGTLVPATWDSALKTFVNRFKQIIADHGPESVAFLSTGQICTEEMALLGALWKFGIGALHCDSNTRQCMATAHVAYKQSFGFDAPPFTYADFEAGDVLVFIGANPCIAHPIMWQRVLRNPNRPRVIVVDPRRTETAMSATQHLALRPKSDLTLLYGVANLLIQNGWLDRPFLSRSTAGFNEFAEFVRYFTPDKVAADTGLTVGQIYHFAEAIHLGKAVSFWWTMGVNQSHEATRTAQAVINLALLTGNIGRPGTGANSITGQCNAMGSRLYSNITGLFAGRDFLKAQDRSEVAKILGIPVERIPTRNSWAYDQIVDGVASGKIKGLWVVATNAAHSWIHGNRFNSLLRKLDFLVVQDLFTTTETAQQAHLILPAAGWGEKDGTFINSERRFGVTRKVSRAPGSALSDFNIFRLIAHYWGCDEMFRDWTSPEAVFQILKKLSAGQPCDIAGIQDYQHLDRSRGIQWPFPENEVGQAELALKGEANTEGFSGLSGVQERRLFADGTFYHADGKARFLFDSPRPPVEPSDSEFPFILLTGRGTSAQWHTNTRTAKSAVLRTLYPANAYVEVNPVDADHLGILPNSKVALVSRRARIECMAFVTPTVQPGNLFMPMHYAVTNKLTCEQFDPHSRQPSYKHCAVRLERLPGSRPSFA
jgi:assimilatory nitrate reductase catalytic subunit